MNNYYIYEYYIIDSGEVFYVGKGKNKRFKNLYSRNKFFKDMYYSHNCDVRKVKIGLTEEEAFKEEIKLIKFYRDKFPQYRLTNQTDGGEGTSGWKPSIEFRRKQSNIHKEQWKDREFRDKMIKIRTDANGVYKSEEFRNKISKLVKGENNPNYNNHWTEDQKKKLRIKQKENDLYKDETNPNAKGVICVETGEIFDCIKFAMNKYKIKTHSSISIALKNKNRLAGNKHWLVYNEHNYNIIKDKDKRFEYLISCYKECKNDKPIVCFDTKEIYPSKTYFSRIKNISLNRINSELKKYNKFIYENKEYILI